MCINRLDNRGGRHDPLRSHFQFVANGKRYIYCRIRKNGCTAVQRFIIATSPHRETDDGGGLAFLRRRHSVRSTNRVRSADHRILVYRDPLERIKSLFVNKFVQRDRSGDIFKNYWRVTGKDPKNAKFEEFIVDYLSRLGDAPLDPHVWPQHWHLCDVIYDLAIPLRSLADGMSKALGPSIASDYFKHKVNPSASYKIEVGSEIRSLVSKIYAEDYRMIERLSGK